MLQNNPELKSKIDQLWNKFWAGGILQASLYGYDIDSTMVRLGLMNLMMHGIDEPKIDYKDSLSKSYLEEAEYDVVMANPPFTGSIDKGDINENLTLATTKTELLFVENIYRLLKKGGTACVIVPQGVLFGSGKAFKDLRDKLVIRCDLKAVITMPSGVFKPYAGVSTAILLFTKVWGPKDNVTRPATESVWFYEMQADGYSLDDKRSKQEGCGDLQEIVARFHGRDVEKDTDRTAQWFCVARANIEAEGYDLSLIFYHLECIYLENLPDSFRFEEEENQNGFRAERAQPDAFELEYVLSIQDGSELGAMGMGGKARIKVTKQAGEGPKWFLVSGRGDEPLKITQTLGRQLLPDYILGYSSGENEILSLPFFKMRFVQFDEYDQALKQQLPYPGRPESRLVYLDSGFSQAILLCNLLFQDADGLTPFREDVKIEELREFRIIIRRSIEVEIGPAAISR